MTRHPASFRSLLFVPGDRLELLAKIPRWQPDAVVIDLEDAVAVNDKAAARRALIEANLDMSQSSILVRVNAKGTPWFDEDVAAVCRSGAAGLVLPKAENPDDVDSLRNVLDERPHGAFLVLGIESALGLARARELLTAGVASAYFGAEDYVGDVGGHRTVDGLEVLYARSELVLAARLAGVPVIDQAVVAINDDAAFKADAEQGRSLGFTGKICVHPRQVALAHETFTPTDAELSTARKVVQALSAGVAVVDGLMVDAAHARMARLTLDRAAAVDGHEK